jgi:heme-degrading monooxygenase HmoA
MVMTVLEARVEPGRAADLERAFREAAAELPAEIVRTSLVRESRDPTLFRIVTFWTSREALMAMRASGETPKGVLIFRAAGAEPELSVSEVVAELEH